MDVAEYHLDGNADAVEFCPHDSFHNILAASTYTLHEGDTPTRTGTISLFDVGDDDLGKLQLIHRVQTPGIFDIKWSPVGCNNVGPLLAQADADGNVKIHKLEDHGSVLKEICGEQVSSSMCLCIDWNPAATSVATGLSDGSVSIISLSESNLSIVNWKAHEFELWASSFDIHQPHLLYTGSDDCNFSCWDLREDPSTTVFQNSRSHKMGVCCIMKNPSDPNILLTGSYDEYLRVWDVRSTSRPVVETSISLGGGVWRIKYHPFIPNLVLTACMHNGFAVVKTKANNAEVTQTYSKHGSLAYGADWQRSRSYSDGSNKKPLVATCSFYDKLLKIWVPEGDIFS
ncbi:methyltransferase [Lithospermum erythrorhizon]|uniref:methylated diphthine methylhydrolase n=1 Tax=Lithospermum erythrorhizon TaxID=34254 RepID=A0AAV3QF44_LITER